MGSFGTDCLAVFSFREGLGMAAEDGSRSGVLGTAVGKASLRGTRARAFPAGLAGFFMTPPLPFKTMREREKK